MNEIPDLRIRTREIHNIIEYASLDALPLHEEGLQLPVLRQDALRAAHGKARKAGHAVRTRVRRVQGRELLKGGVRVQHCQQQR